MRLSCVLVGTGALRSASALTLWPSQSSPGNVSPTAANDINVDLGKTYQTIDGFGCSFAFQRANLITNMSDKTKQRELLDLLFNTTSGAGFSIIRNGIGSSPDSSSDHMNSFAPKNPGGPKAAPQDVWDGKDSGQLFISQEAVKTYGVKTIYADAWSAPGYMKSNGNENNGGTLCGLSGTNCASGDWRQAYADYLVRYVKYYADAGVPVTHLGFLNEPEFAASYASMASSGQQAAEFIKILSSTIQSANLSAQVGITCCDSEGWSNQVNMMNSIKSAGADTLLKAVTSHTYTGGSSGPMNTKVPVWLSEQCDLNGQWTSAWYSNGGAGEGLTWANNIYSAVTSTQASGYVYWEGVQWPDPDKNEKLIKVAKTSPYDYEVSKRLWAIASWSRFVRPGAVRVSSSGGTGVKSAAFKNVDGSIAVVVISTGSSASTVNIKIAGLSASAATSWVTDTSHNCAQTNSTIADGVVTGNVAARSVTTFLISSPNMTEIATRSASKRR